MSGIRTQTLAQEFAVRNTQTCPGCHCETHRTPGMRMFVSVCGHDQCVPLFRLFFFEINKTKTK